CREVVVGIAPLFSSSVRVMRDSPCVRLLLCRDFANKVKELLLGVTPSGVERHYLGGYFALRREFCPRTPWAAPLGCVNQVTAPVADYRKILTDHQRAPNLL